MKKAVRLASEKVVEQLRGMDDSDKEMVFDPGIIVVIADLLVPLIEALQNCKGVKASKVPAMAANPTLIQRITVRTLCRRNVDRDFWRHNERALVQAVLDAAADATPEQIQELFDVV